MEEAMVLMMERDALFLIMKSQLGGTISELELRIEQLKGEKQALGLANGVLEKEKQEALTRNRVLESANGVLERDKKAAWTRIEVLESSNGILERDKKAALTRIKVLESSNGVLERDKKAALTSIGALKLDNAILDGDNQAAMKINRELKCAKEMALRRIADLESRLDYNNQLDRCAIGFIPVYFLIATTFCNYRRHNFKGMETGSLFSILYFVVVVTFTVGYGDVVPTTLGTKLLTCLLVAIGGQVSPCLISLQSYAWRKVRDIFPQITSETRRKVLTFCLALIAIIISVVVGMMGFLYFENGKGVGKLLDNNLNGTDAFYASLMSLTTEGFGDYSFKTEHGRVFAVFWLLICVPMYVSALTHVVRVIVSATCCFYSF